MEVKCELKFYKQETHAPLKKITLKALKITKVHVFVFDNKSHIRQMGFLLIINLIFLYKEYYTKGVMFINICILVLNSLEKWTRKQLSRNVAVIL